jgi:hypothetical protein
MLGFFVCVKITVLRSYLTENACLQITLQLLKETNTEYPKNISVLQHLTNVNRPNNLEKNLDFFS